LEYFDERGKFHFKDWHPDKGMIIRSIRFDPRNRNGSMIYSSLIVDAVKIKRKNNEFFAHNR
jgi:predicted SAM-dependent methyltransferase